MPLKMLHNAVDESLSGVIIFLLTQFHYSSFQKIQCVNKTNLLSKYSGKLTLLYASFSDYKNILPFYRSLHLPQVFMTTTTTLFCHFQVFSVEGAFVIIIVSISVILRLFIDRLLIFCTDLQQQSIRIQKVRPKNCSFEQII